jgi:hypothetical protein
MYFVLESAAWTGGMAFYDQAEPGKVAARAYLITASQFSDVLAQEMYRRPDVDLDLTEVLDTGRCELGPGRYETIALAGHRDGCPMLTFTAPWRMADVEWNRPSDRYLRHLAAGLAEAHSWDVRRIAEYLAACPGVSGELTSAEVENLLR